MMNLSYQKQNPKIHVLIVAPFTMVQECLQRLLESSDEITVTKSSNDESSLIDSISSNQPDIIVFYLMDGDTESVKFIPQLQQTAPNAKVIVLTAEKDRENQILAVKLGAAGVIHKQQSAGALIKAIKRIYKGETWISHQLLAQLLRNDLPDKNGNSKCREKTGIESLTEREKEVVKLIGRGLKNKEIANNLCICETTVRHHLSSIYGKLFITDRLNLIIYAYQHGLIPLFNEKSNNKNRIEIPAGKLQEVSI